MKLPVVSGKEVPKVLLKLGFTIQRQKGSHVHLTKQTEDKILRVTVSVHANEELNPFVFRSIARQSGHTPEEFAKLF